MSEKTSVIDRPPVLSPRPDHNQYNRYKYYSALRTGYKHLAPAAADESFLQMPLHIIDSNLFLLMNPFDVKKEGKASSIVIVFSCWKTMMGSAVVSMPWAFQQSGMGLGMIISFISFVISYYTCYLIVEMTGDDPDFSDTARKYYGKINLLFLTLLSRSIRILYRSVCPSNSHPRCNHCLLRHHVPDVLSYCPSSLQMDFRE